MIKKKINDFETKFEEVDVDNLISILEVEKKAKMEAEKELPLSDSLELDVNEYRIQNFLKNEIKKANDFVIDKLAVFNQILFRTSTAINDAIRINHFHEQYRNNFSHFIEKMKDDFLNFKNIVDSSHRDLENFKIENGINRDEQSPNSKVLSVSLLFFIVFLEALLNFNFFAKGSELGIIGGVFQSVIISIINGIMAYFFVLLWRKKELIFFSKTQKNFIYVASGLVVIAIALFHLIVGHYRDALGLDPEKAYILSIQNFSSSPFNLIGFESWLLVFFGILLFIFMVIDIYKMEDTYPGYTKITKRYEKAKVELDNFKYEIIEGVKNIEEDACNELKLMIKNIVVINDEILNIPNFAERLEKKYDEHLNHLNDAYNVLIKRYRNINVSSRNTSAPKYFDQKELLDNYNKMDFGLEGDLENIKKLGLIIEELPIIEAKVFKKLTDITTEFKEKNEFLNA